MEHLQNSIDLYVKRCTQRRSECRQVWEDLSLKKEWFSKEFHWLSMEFEGNVIHIEWMGHCSVDDNDMALSVITLAQVGRAYSTLCVCVCVCVLPQNCCSSSIIPKSKQAASHKLGNLKQTVVLYKTGNSSYRQTWLKWGVKLKTKKLTIQILHERLLNQANGRVLLETCENLPRNGDITVTTLCTKLTCCHAVDWIGTLWFHSTWQQLLYSCNKYFGAKRCFLLNNARCKISQKLRLFSAIGHFAYSNMPFTC